MRVLVAGGRDFQDAQLLMRVLNQYGIEEICEGGASGADWWAREYARAQGIPHRTYRANWDMHGKAAGPIRNQQMLDDFKPDVVVAFPGGKGTAHMVSIANKAGVRVIQVDPSS